MTYAFIATVVILAFLFVYALRQFDRERSSWTEERGELLNRIQHPERIPVARAEPFVTPERQLDEWNKVGTIELDLNGDDENG